MYPAANEVQIPMDPIKKELRRYARRGFSGTVTVRFRVLPEAALDVELTPEVRETQNAGRQSFASPDWDQVNGSREPTALELKLEQKLVENAHRFRLGMKLTEVRAVFIDGALDRFELVSVG